MKHFPFKSVKKSPSHGVPTHPQSRSIIENSKKTEAAAQGMGAARPRMSACKSED